MDFKNFLLKYSTINEKFIEDFYNIINEDYIEKYNDFLIECDILMKWLKIEKKQKIKDTLLRSYRENIDYIIKKVKQSKGSGGHNNEIIMLTPECATNIFCV